MVNIVGVRFRNAGKLYFFDPNGNWPSPGDYVVVDTTRGLEIGEAVTVVHEVPEEGLTLPLRCVLRVATAQDLEQDRANRIAARDAQAVCLRKIEEHKLDMKLVETQFTLDNTKLIFYFTANGRVDFRSLVKDLASVFHLRIELRQIGVRDEAKMLGGLGPCGRPICCGTFLGDFQPVSIRMAKDQGLSLNPTKISGICGRLMCCLKYEESYYEDAHRRLPRVGREVQTPDGAGVVTDTNVLKETVRVRIQKGDSAEIKEYAADAVHRTGQSVPFETAESPETGLSNYPDGMDESAAEAAAVIDPENDASDVSESEEATAEAPAAEPETENKGVSETPVGANNWLEALENAMRAAESKE